MMLVYITVQLPQLSKSWSSYFLNNLVMYIQS